MNFRIKKKMGGGIGKGYFIGLIIDLSKTQGEIDSEIDDLAGSEN